MVGGQVNHQRAGFIAHVCTCCAPSALWALQNMISWTYFYLGGCLKRNDSSASQELKLGWTMQEVLSVCQDPRSPASYKTYNSHEFLRLMIHVLTWIKQSPCQMPPSSVSDWLGRSSCSMTTVEMQKVVEVICVGPADWVVKVSATPSPQARSLWKVLVTTGHKPSERQKPQCLLDVPW